MDINIILSIASSVGKSCTKKNAGSPNFWCKIFGHEYFIKDSDFTSDGYKIFILECSKCGHKTRRKETNETFDRADLILGDRRD